MALWGILYTIVPLVLVGGLVLAAASMARKDEYEPRRSYVVYLLGTILVSLLVLVGGVTVVVANIGERVVGTGGEVYDGGPFSGGVYIDDSGNPPSHSDEFIDRINTGEAIQAALVAGVALLLLYFHASKLTEITREGGFATSLLARTYSAYLYLVCFAAMIGALVATAISVYALVKIAAPGSLGSLPEGDERDLAIVDLLQNGALAGLSAYIFRWHWKAAEALRPGATG